MKPLKLIYFGTPQFSAEILDSLFKLKIENCKFHVVGVVTQPDVLVGRKQILTPSPVSILASKYDLPVFKPTKLDEAHLSHLRLLKPDIFLVASYGQIVPNSYLETAKVLNLHFSLLPKYRGALCISEAIKNQDAETGVTLMEMTDKLDAGPIIAQEKVKIDLDDNVATLTTKLTQSAISLLKSEISNLKSQISHPQDESLATYTPKISSRTRVSAFIPWSDISPCLQQSQISNVKCQMLHALIRSFNPDPGAWTKIRIKDKGESIKEIELKILKTNIERDFNLQPLSFRLELVQLPGKTPISWSTFLAGHKLEI